MRCLYPPYLGRAVGYPLQSLTLPSQPPASFQNPESEAFPPIHNYLLGIKCATVLDNGFLFLFQHCNLLNISSENFLNNFNYLLNEINEKQRLIDGRSRTKSQLESYPEILERTQKLFYVCCGFLFIC